MYLVAQTRLCIIIKLLCPALWICKIELHLTAQMPVWSTILCWSFGVLYLSYLCRFYAALRLLGVVQDEIQRLGPSVEALSKDGVMEAILTQVIHLDSQG